jgi:hypothetical protein
LKNSAHHAHLQERSTEANLMPGHDVQQGRMFSYVFLESRVPPTHPPRRMKSLLDEADWHEPGL